MVILLYLSDTCYTCQVNQYTLIMCSIFLLLFQAVADFVLLLEKLLPIAQGGSSLVLVRNSFVNATVSSSKVLVEALSTMVNI